MRLFNTLSRKKEEFVPLAANEVKMYSCGPTVYNYFHIGNARPFIIFDTLRKYLTYRGYNVKFVQNFTDVDDKMINKANEEGISVKELADRYIKEYFVDSKGLGIDEATVHPRATENIDAIIDLIKTLEDKGYAYSVDGDVYFKTNAFDQYGKLSQQNFEDLRVGAKNEVGEKKQDPMDFALWKAQKPGEPAWDSPWGKGRPGWHIECSAMSMKFLGDTIDIHSGGQDLIFPHHENEIAQSEAATGKPFSKFWIHNGFINVDGEKMSKSGNNFFTVRDIIKEFDYEVIRFFMLSAHYRSPINFAPDLLQQAKNGLERIYNCLENLRYLKEHAQNIEMAEDEKAFSKKLLQLKDRFIEAMDDDINTADAISVVFDMVREVNSYFTGSSAHSVAILDYSYLLIRELGGVLGIAQKEKSEDIDSKIQELVELRQKARKEKDWKTADEIRDKLKDMGVTLEDTPQGVKLSIENK